MMFDSKDAGMGTQTINPAEHRLRSPGLCRHREPIVKKVLRLWEQIRLSREPGKQGMIEQIQTTNKQIFECGVETTHFQRKRNFPFIS